jgi:hypothetical protein
VTPREAAVLALGAEAVESYEAVKRFYSRLGMECQTTYATAVGGRVGRILEADVITRIGDFEFCMQANTKNSAGEAAQRWKAGPGRTVQVSGTPRRGRMSGVEFLAMHGVLNPELVADECIATAAARARQPAIQLSLLK